MARKIDRAEAKKQLKYLKENSLKIYLYKEDNIQFSTYTEKVSWSKVDSFMWVCVCFSV